MRVMSLLRPALLLMLVLSLITGIVYPFALTGVAQLLFSRQANGSLVELRGRVVGSELIGQSFQDPRYFWSRPSATTPMAYNAAASSGSNLGPLNPALADAVRERVAALRQADPGNSSAVPVDLVTASGSGLDPDISPAAARYQVSRVARLRGLQASTVQSLVDAQTQPRQWGVLGEPRVNVLRLNLALDRLR